jgi:hypothetical protein
LTGKKKKEKLMVGSLCCMMKPTHDTSTNKISTNNAGGMNNY